MIIETELTNEQYEEITGLIRDHEVGLYIFYGQKGNYKVKVSEDKVTVLEIWEGILWE